MFRFKKIGSPHETSLAMIGAKSGQAVVVLGADGPLAGAIGLVTGLNGRTVVVDRAQDAAARVQLAAEQAGALVEFVDAPMTMTPLDPASFDIAVVRASLERRASSDRAAIVGEAFRLVREGGRVVVIEGSRRSGLFAGPEPRLDATEIASLLGAAGARAARQLADADGTLYFEARR